MNYHKNIFQLLILSYSVLYYTQSYKGDSLTGEFTYRLRAKFDKRTDNRYEELFTLQVGNRRAFFASAISLKGDSVMENSRVTTKNYDGSITLSYKDDAVIPKTNFNFTIIQTNENIQYFDLAGMSLLTYKEPVIKNWKLVDETKIINTINCKKNAPRNAGHKVAFDAYTYFIFSTFAFTSSNLSE